MTVQHFVEPSLFDQIDDYLKEYEADPKKADASRLRTFAENFFLQFFANALRHKIIGVNREAKDLSARLRIRQRGSGDAPLRRLLARFERLCDLLPMIAGQLSRPGEEAPAEFRNRYMNQLMEAIASWAEHGVDKELAARAASARDAYGRAFP
jgi:hypothetical protein